MPSRIDTLREVLAHYSSPLTLNYPSNVVADRKYSQIPDGLRGLIERSKDKCIGCRACSNVCSGEATTYYDNLEQATRTISVFHFRCTFCQHCQIECPTEAITLTKKFEFASTSRDDPANFELTTLDLLRCKKCGKPFFPQKYVDNAFESLIQGKATGGGHRAQGINPLVKEVVAADFQKVKEYCPDCRRLLALQFDTHTKKHIWLEGS